MKYIKIDDKKRPKHSLSNSFNREDVERERNLAVLVEEPYIVIDVDDMDDFNIIDNIIEDYDIKCKIMKSDRGGHFWFRRASPIRNRVDVKNALTLRQDIKSYGKKSTVTVKYKDEWRIWTRDDEDVDVLPKWLEPLSTKQELKGMKDGDGRNPGLFSLIIPLIKSGFNMEEVKFTLTLINDYVFRDPLSQDEIDAMIDGNSQFDNAALMFMDGSRFLHDEFSRWIVKTHFINYEAGSLYLYENGIYIRDERKIEQLMIEQIPTLRYSQRRETLLYISLLDNRIESPPEDSFVVQNGVYTISTRKLTPHSPKYFYTNKLNCKYDSKAKCEAIDTMMKKLFKGDETIIKMVEEMLGYILFNHVRFQKVFVLIGPGGNGKSTFLNMIREWVGPENCSALSIEDTSHRFRAANIVDKRVNLGDDVSGGLLDNSSNFKSLVTGDDIMLERKGKDPFNYSFKGKMIFTSNDLPSFRDKSEGLLRRIIFIPFTVPFSVEDEDYDPFIEEKITTEEAKSYLLNIAIRGAERLLKNKQFTDSDKINKLHNEFKKENNNIIQWFEHINFEKDIKDRPTNEVYVDYKFFCNSSGLKPQGIRSLNKYIRRKTKYDTEIEYDKGSTVQIWRKVKV